MRKYVIFGSSWVVSPSNRALYITSIGWVISLILGVVLITLSLFPPTGYPYSPHGASVDASYVTEMSQFAYWVHATYLHSPLSLCSCSKEVEAWVDHSSVMLNSHVGHSRYSYWFIHILFVWVLPHYPALLSTSCWLMGDASMPSFQWIPFHRLQIIYSGIGF